MAYPESHADDDLGSSVFGEEDDSDVGMAPSTNGYGYDYLPVDNHSSNTTEADLKAREAASEQRRSASSAALPSQLTSPALSAISMPWSEPDNNSNNNNLDLDLDLNTNTNPPDYATATANQPAYRSPPRPTTDHSLPADQQQSMSDAVVVDSDEETGLLAHRPTNKRKRTRRPSWCGKISTCNIFLILAVIALIVLLSRVAFGGHNSNDGGTTDPEQPKNPDDNDDKNKDPTNQPYFPGSSCAYQHYSESEYIDFASPQNFTLTEFMGFMETTPLSEGVKGTLHVQPAAQLDQGVDIRLTIAYATTSQLHVSRSNYVMDRDNFALEMPDFQISQEPTHERSCLGVFVGIEVRPGVELENWALLTGNLDIFVADGLFDTVSGAESQPHLKVNGNSTFSGVSGDGHISYWSSRKTIIEFVSGNIGGTFALRDLLHLKTLSGKINATIDPKDADPAHVVPAQFSAASTSGSIDVQFPTTGDKLPKRNFQTSLETISSPIRGNYIVGTSLNAHTTSGNIQAQLLPFYTDKLPSNINTDSKSGKSTLRVLPPYPEDSWPGIKSEHRSTSTSGSVDIVYPPQWEGEMDAQTLSGSISIKGKDVKIIDESRGPVLKRLKAGKGLGHGHMGLKTLSGDIKVRIDDD